MPGRKLSSMFQTEGEMSGRSGVLHSPQGLWGPEHTGASEEEGRAETSPQWTAVMTQGLQRAPQAVGTPGSGHGMKPDGSFHSSGADTGCAAYQCQHLRYWPPKHRKNTWSWEAVEEIRHPILLEFGNYPNGPLSVKKETEKTWLADLQGNLRTIR